MEKKDDSIGTLWENTSKAGLVYYKGNVNGEKIVMFSNKYKENDTQPTFRICKDKEQTSVITPEEVGKARKTELETVNEEANEILASDLPF